MTDSTFIHACTRSHFRLSETLWTVVRQALLSMRFSRQEYWSELQCPAPRDLPDSGTDPTSLMPPGLAATFFSATTTWEAKVCGLVPCISQLWHLRPRELKTQ